MEATRLTLEPTEAGDLFDLRIDGDDPGGVVMLEPVEHGGRTLYRMVVARTSHHRAGRFTRDAAQPTER